jgi:hypothetical protein
MNTNKAQILPNEKSATDEKLIVLTSIITNLPGDFAGAVFPILKSI